MTRDLTTIPFAIRCALGTCLVVAFQSVVPADDARPFGIENRVPWTTSRISGSPEPPAPYGIERRFPNLQFNNPVVLTSAPGTDHLFVVEVEGKIYSFPNDNDYREPDLFFDMRGLLPEINQ